MLQLLVVAVGMLWGCCGCGLALDAVVAGIGASRTNVEEQKTKTMPPQVHELAAGENYDAAAAILLDIDPTAEVGVSSGNGNIVSKIRTGGKNRLIRTEFRSGTLYRIVDAKTEEVLEPPKNPAPSP
ncbi:MAG: hypothetical protein COT39_04335 [Parcubacteria group bacterium CG08_land_8_20_14_0_20_48_21]|nr:MAG: hypothetical protein COT39_04335 [Parcubacteria group bacterium CG08_land_8_20_14_0_20_48_21]